METFRATCVRCKTTIESLHSHDFKMCTCKRIGIDGGGPDVRERRYIGNHNDFAPGDHPCHFLARKTTTTSRFDDDATSWWDEQ